MCILCQGCPIAILGLVFWWLLLWWVFMAYPIGLLVYSSSGGFWFYVNSLDCQPLLHRLVMREAQFLKPRPDPQFQRLSSSSAASSAIRGLIPHNRGLFLKFEIWLIYQTQEWSSTSLYKSNIYQTQGDQVDAAHFNAGEQRKATWQLKGWSFM